MKKQTKLHTESEKKAKKTGKNNCIFGKIKRLFFGELKSRSSGDLPSSLILIRPDILKECLPVSLTNSISLFRLLGWQVQVQELPSQIECEGIGYHLHFEGKQLIMQERLQLQVEYVEKKTVLFERLDLTCQKIDEDTLRNLLNS
jgi:hypothetical protein